MAFAGVSLIAEDKLCPLTKTLIDSRADRGYHLLVVEDYGRSQGSTPNGWCIQSRPFLVGGHRWIIKYYPYGYKEDDEDFISVFLVLDDDVGGLGVKAQSVFTFIDQPELRMSTRISKRQIPFDYCYEKEYFMRRDELERSKHLKSGSFIIRCDISVLRMAAEASTDEVSGITDSFAEMPLADMQSDLGDLLLSEEGADIAFDVGGETFAAHQCVLAARSAIFKQLLFGDTTMTKKNVIEIHDIEPHIFRNLLVFMYTDSFPDWEWKDNDEEYKSGEEEEEEEIVSGECEGYDEYITWLLQLHEAADRYDLQRLKSICEEQVLECICRGTVAGIIVVAERRQCPWLKERCVEFIKSHSSLYTALTAESLNQIIRTCSPFVLNELIFKFSP